MCHLWVTNLGSYCEGVICIYHMYCCKASCLLPHKTQDHSVASINGLIIDSSPLFSFSGGNWYNLLLVLPLIFHQKSLEICETSAGKRISLPVS